MQLMSEAMNFAETAADVPPEIVSIAHDASRTVSNPDEARKVLVELMPALRR